MTSETSDTSNSETDPNVRTRLNLRVGLQVVIILSIVGVTFIVLLEKARQNQRRQSLNSPQEDVEQAGQVDHTHPLDPILDIAYQSLKTIKTDVIDYTAELARHERIGEQLMPPSRMALKIRNPRDDQAFSIYVLFTEPENTKGREVIWVDGKNDNNIVAHEAGFLGLLRVVQPPDSFVAMVGNRYPVTETGFQKLMEKLIQYGLRDRKFGDCEVEILDDVIVGSVQCKRLRIIHPVKEGPYTFHIAEVDMDMRRQIPIRLATWDWPEPGQQPQLVEEYVYHNVELNVGLQDLDFNPDNPAYHYPD